MGHYGVNLSSNAALGSCTAPNAEPHPNSQAAHGGIPETMVCEIRMFMWPLGRLLEHAPYAGGLNVLLLDKGKSHFEL